jgi:cytochrome c biogenesis protein CcdA
VPLSEHEQRLLEQIERALYAEDPKFASTVRGGRLRKPTRRRRLQGAALFVVGLVLLVVGVAVPQLWLGSFPVLSVVGFLMMLGGAVLAVTSVGSSAQAPEAKTTEADKNRFTGRMEERFRRRFEQE